jgi:DNA-binding beta-propeller fold protein YncE
MRLLRIFFKFAVVLSALISLSASGDGRVFPNNSSFTLFESGQVRPLALSPNRKLLFAVNTPDNRLEVFDTRGSKLRSCGSITVGLEPVAVAARTNREVWVVNHLSDSVSIIRLNEEACDEGEPGRAGERNVTPGHIVRTLLVGDEPRDIVFAGPRRARAFITTAHRGQNAPYDPQLTTPGVGRADVWVFDADNLGNSLEGKPLNIITLFTDTPRALAVSPDGSRVYAAGFETGNRTTTIFERVVTANGGTPGPHTNWEGMPQPETGLIVKFNGQHWVDETGRAWDQQVKFSLPDKDVFVIDAMGDPPTPLLGSTGFFQGVGTTLFNMIVNPANGHVYVSNLDSQNLRRFEGPGVFAGETVRGHLAESRITVLADGAVLPRHLNKHIDYTRCCAPIPNAENARSLAFPTGMAITRDGDTLYVAAFGSSKVGVFDTRALENDSFVPSVANQIEVSGGGPSGVVLDDQQGRLYVLTRFDDAISVVDTRARREIAHVPMYNPEPAHIVKGRRFLYDARYTSSHGDSACASCHIFGDFDSLAWDLGNPDASEVANPSPLVVTPASVGFPQIPVHFRPMKGPMVTQSMRGLANHGSEHWRGDRNGGYAEPNIQPDSGVYNEQEAFRQFNVAFPGLVGRNAPLTAEEMQAFTDFAMEIMYPPNPIRRLDNTLTPSQQAGRDYFFGHLADPFSTCGGCHHTDPTGNAEFGVKKPGFFGADGRGTFELEPQVLKIPQLRNMYQKVGMFGMPRVPGFFLPEADDPNVDNAFMGDQVRGFGFMHDGAADTVFRFLKIVFFQHSAPESAFPNPGGFDIGPDGDKQRRQVEDYVLAFDTNFAPIVGQQVTLADDNESVVAPRLALLMARSDAGDCDLIAKRWQRGREKGYLYVGSGLFRSDRLNEPLISDADLRAYARRPNGETTYTCVPPLSGTRIGVDRDEDGAFDGDEIAAGSNPANARSKPY